MIERKCRECNQWNDDRDFCIKCGAALSPKAREAKKQANIIPEGPSIPEQLLAKARNARFLVLKFMYYSAYGILILFISIGGFIAWFTAVAAA